MRSEIKVYPNRKINTSISTQLKVIEIVASKLCTSRKLNFPVALTKPTTTIPPRASKDQKIDKVRLLITEKTNKMITIGNWKTSQLA